MTDNNADVNGAIEAVNISISAVAAVSDVAIAPTTGGLVPSETPLSNISPEIALEDTKKVRGRPRKHPKVDKDSAPKKRGRPRKIVGEGAAGSGSSNSSEQQYKFINKSLIDSIRGIEPGTKRELTQEEREQLLLSKDRRGRPRKFPIEVTGTTIRGVKIGGTSNNKRGRPRKVSTAPLDEGGINGAAGVIDEIEKRSRGRPRKIVFEEDNKVPKPRGRPRKYVIPNDRVSITDTVSLVEEARSISMEHARTISMAQQARSLLNTMDETGKSDVTYANGLSGVSLSSVSDSVST